MSRNNSKVCWHYNSYVILMPSELTLSRFFCLVLIIFTLKDQWCLNYGTHITHLTIPEESKTKFVSYGCIYSAHSVEV